MTPSMFGQQQVSWGELTAVAGLIVTAGGVVAAIVVFLWTRFNALEREHAEFRIEVARTYVTSAALMEIERRLSASIDRLADRIEKMFDRGRERVS